MLQAIKGTLQSTPDIDGIYTLNAVPAISALRAVEEVGARGEVMIGTADLSNEVLEAIKAGDIAFAMDQQPYLRASCRSRPPSSSSTTASTRSATSRPGRYCAADRRAIQNEKCFA